MAVSGGRPTRLDKCGRIGKTMLSKFRGALVASIKELADRIARDWTEGEYYRDAERSINEQWSGLIWPIIEGCDFTITLDLAAGHGRNTAKLLEVAGKVIAVDVNDIAPMRRRFGPDSDRLVLIRNNGFDLSAIADESVTFVYCWDAMVHFYPEVVRRYIGEFRRIMAPGARGFVHYSNNHADPKADYRRHPGWRNYMSREIFEGWLKEEGLRPISSFYLKDEIIPADNGDCDAMTLFERPG